MLHAHDDAKGVAHFLVPCRLKEGLAGAVWTLTVSTVVTHPSPTRAGEGEEETRSLEPRTRGEGGTRETLCVYDLISRAPPQWTVEKSDPVHKESLRNRFRSDLLPISS